MGSFIGIEEEEEAAGEPPRAGQPRLRPGCGTGWYAGQPAALRRDFEREWRAAEDRRQACGPQARAGTLELEEPLAPASAAEYLREILTREDSLAAAFQPVLRAAWCACPEGLRVVDRGAFAQAVVRISAHFNPSEPIVLRMACAGPPFSSEEALGHFRLALCLLADRLAGALRSPDPARPPPHSVGAACPTPRSGACAAGVGGAPVAAASPASSPGPSPRASSLEEHDEAARGLEASRARVLDLQRLVAREEGLLAHQGEEVLRLERLERDLEAQKAARARQARHGTPPGCRGRAPGGRRRPRPRPGCAQVDWGSLKQQITASRLLSARMEALEAEKAEDWDDREEPELSDEP